MVHDPGLTLQPYKTIGSALRPRSVKDSRHSGAAWVANWSFVARLTSVPMAICASSRARGAPRQK